MIKVKKTCTRSKNDDDGCKHGKPDVHVLYKDDPNRNILI